jgi:hypothetical protein
MAYMAGENMKGLIILDFNRTLYDPDTSQMLEGALEFLEDYSKMYSLALIGKGDDKRASLIGDLGIKRYFRYMKLKEEKEKNSVKTDDVLAEGLMEIAEVISAIDKTATDF